VLAALAVIAGFALDGNTLFTWGENIQRRTLPAGPPQTIAAGAFSEGGCLMDVDGDGRLDLVVMEAGAHPGLVWFHAPEWSRHTIAEGIDSPDILPTTLLGKRGILLVHKRQQVRFYEAPKTLDGRWAGTEIYSIYTPSREGGLQLADVNGDGLPDILCGNYWMQSPREFSLPWREFAIDLWNEEPDSALFRIAWANLFGTTAHQRIALQRAMPHARLAWFEVPSDPRLLWREHRLGEDLNLTNPNSLEVVDFDDDGAPDILIAENAPKGRVILFHNDGAGKFTSRVLTTAPNIIGARKYADGLLLITKRGAGPWPASPTRTPAAARTGSVASSTVNPARPPK
jgi:hypothetical protein